MVVLMRRIFLVQIFLGFIFCVSASKVLALEVVEAKVERKHNIFYIDFTVNMNIPAQQTYTMLMDYDRLHEYSDQVLQSKVLNSKEREKTVFTHAHGCLFVFCNEIKKTERLQAESDTLITATLIANDKNNVKRSDTRWEITALNEQATQLDYSLAFEPDFWMPKRAGRKMLRSGLAVLINMEKQFLQTVSEPEKNKLPEISEKSEEKKLKHESQE